MLIMFPFFCLRAHALTSPEDAREEVIGEPAIIDERSLLQCFASVDYISCFNRVKITLCPDSPAVFEQNPWDR